MGVCPFGLRKYWSCCILLET